MADESGARAAPTLTGSLCTTPLPALLAGARDRGISGTFTFVHGEHRDRLIMRCGAIAAVRTAEPVAYLGGILYEIGAIDMATLNETLHDVATKKRLHGDILVERGSVTRDRIDEALVEQTMRQVHHLFSLPEETTWGFRPDVDELAGARDESRPAVDTWQAIWRGLRDQSAAPYVRRALAKIDGGIYLRDLQSVELFGLAPEELALCERLNAQPSLLTTLVSTSKLSAERTELLVYLLTLARCIVRVDPQPVGPVELGIEGIRLRAQRIDAEDAYTTLGLRSGASRDAARAAFFRLARLWHPDKIPPALAEVRAECQRVFVRIGEAHRSVTGIGGRLSIDSMIGTDNAGAANDSVRPLLISRDTLRDADAALARNDLAAAGAIARTLTSAGADGPGARAILAWCALGAGGNAERQVLEHGLSALDKLLTGDPDCVRALCYRAHVLKHLGRPDDALRDYRKVVRLDPRHVDAQREIRLSEIRRRGADGEKGATTLGKPHSHETHGEPIPAAHAPPAPVVPAAPGQVGREDAAVRSGLRRLMALVSGSK